MSTSPTDLVEEPQAHKRVSWAELFFDLVFVFAVTQLTALLHADHSWAGVGRALIVFVPVYWTWVGMSVHTNTRNVENPLDRLGIFAVGLASLMMALALPGAFADRAVLFASAYLAARVLLLGLVLRSRRLFLNPFTVAVLVSGPLRLIGAFLPVPALVTLWAVAGVVDIATPAVARRLVAAQIRFNPSHLPERFGLFLIIALGESIVAVGVPAASSPRLGAGVILAVAVAFALTCGLWWIYFMFSADAMVHSLEAIRERADVVREVLTYGHFALIGSIVAIAVGLTEVIADPVHHLDLGVTGLLFGGAALYLAAIGFIQRRLAGRWSWRELIPAAVTLVLVPVATLLPALVALVMLLVVMALAVVAEHRGATISR